MSAKSNADVIIGGKVYTLAGYESEDYLQRVAAYINNKVSEFEHMESTRRMSGDMKATLIHLNIADDYFKAKGMAEKLEEDVQAKEKEIYDLRHDIISNQIKMEGLEKTISDLQTANKELAIKNAKLEGSVKENEE